MNYLDSVTFTKVIPSLMINGKLVCIGRSPSRGEVIEWLKNELVGVAHGT